MVVKKKFNENLTTLVSRSTEINGDVFFSGTLEIEGKVRGNVYADEGSSAEVRVRESGLVQGEIKVPSVIVNGLVEGDVYSSKHIEIAAKGRVVGSVYYHLIEMVMGSEVNGSLCHRTTSEFENPKLIVESDAVTEAGDSIILD